VRPTVQGAALVLENKTGRILAMAGSFSYPLSQLNRTSQTQRQPGSAIKPLTYLTALQKGLQPNTLIRRRTGMSCAGIPTIGAISLSFSSDIRDARKGLRNLSPTFRIEIAKSTCRPTSRPRFSVPGGNAASIFGLETKPVKKVR
jgi:Penicillin binding protein transpeptidase domain